MLLSQSNKLLRNIILITQKAGFDFEFSAPPSSVLELSNTERVAPASLSPSWLCPIP